MKTLRIAEDLILPVDVVTEKLAFLGRTGSGKSYAATKLAELMLDAGAQIVALDPVGVWYGLRVGGDWTVYIFGGLHGDFPLEPTGGALMADIIIDRGISAVLDVSQFIRSEQIRFAKDFIVRFYERRKASPAPIHLFVEEAQEFIPQNPQGNEAEMLHHFERAWKIGRNYGIGGTLISQRPQELNKKALNQAATLFVFQMTGPQERKALETWIADKGIDEDIEAMLPKLKVGQPHAWIQTSFLNISRTVTILPKKTADVSTTPRLGDRAKERPLTPVDLERLKSDMAATVERSKADDPKELRKQIAQLKQQIVELEKRPTQTNTIEVSVLTEEDRQQFQALANLVVLFKTDLDSMKGVTEEIRTICEKAAAHKMPATAPKMQPPVHQKPAPTHKPVTSAHKVDSGLSGAERRILTVLAQYPAGKETTALAHLAGYTVNGHFNNMLGALRSKGYANRGTPVTATPEGIAALGDYEPLPTGEELRNYWRNKLSGSERRILEPLLDAYPNGLTADELARRAGYTVNGHFNNMIGHLRTIELVQRGSPIRASDTLFE